jgi:hypothetical protein
MAAGSVAGNRRLGELRGQCLRQVFGCRSDDVRGCRCAQGRDSVVKRLSLWKGMTETNEAISIC